jgi:uncharacterized protein (DUF427 family)
MTERTISIKANKTGTVLASGQVGVDVRLFEGAWYFAAEAVDTTHLVVTDRTYICPYKGTCYWIDLKMPDFQAKNVAFTYFKVNPGYEFVKDQIGFYAGRREATAQVDEPVSS